MHYGPQGGVAGGGEVVLIALHVDGLQPPSHGAQAGGELRAAGVQQGGVGPWDRAGMGLGIVRRRPSQLYAIVAIYNLCVSVSVRVYVCLCVCI